MSKVNFTAQVTIHEAMNTIKEVGHEITPIIVSEPGCGKSSILKMLEQDMGDAYDYIYVDCPVKDMSDIAMTIPNHNTQALEYYVSKLFKLDSPKPKVIMLDEMMKAPKLLQIIFTRLTLERTIGDVPLPEGSIVFATSNNSSDGVGDSMMAHAGNRVCIIKMAKPDANTWLQWASSNGVNKLIRAWVAMYPRSLHSYMDGGQEDNPYIFNPKKAGQLSFVSPRSLAKASIIIDKRDALGENATLCALAGTLGESCARDMSAFLSLEKQLPDLSEVLKNPKTVKVPDEVAATLMLMFQAIDALKTQDELSSFMEFVNRVASAEIQAVFFTMLMRSSRTTKLARNNMQIAEWAKNNHELF
jgi:L-fucose mutarotase/ribose pyranase (RbsD/FucU family)